MRVEGRVIVVNNMIRQTLIAIKSILCFMFMLIVFLSSDLQECKNDHMRKKLFPHLIMVTSYFSLEKCRQCSGTFAIRMLNRVCKP